ncbi:TonB-dependent receptor [Pontibacter sp. G13]|uniref:SusC/RagA family TonB-linked outer membrane protein n=1 Tax=Pontibacter sp. G13 TaxID=3074898 RepID=UPI00288C159A|nr:TonB-dependent receptor [Pontibacter sp. G13]WNJ20577.1 TonB-dependent receptor [Pontibacter sp. G13]
MKRLLLKPSFRQLVILWILLAPLGLSAQNTLTGTVNASDSGEPLTGATVLIEGTNAGAFTDDNGAFSLNVPDGGNTLVVSFIGYETQQVDITNKTQVSVTLQVSDQLLDEVVVVGYTTRKKGELTGSVSTVESEVIERTTNKDLVKSLAGKVPGLIVSDRGGYPGGTGDVSILIRGKSTLNNNNPLILVDGVPSESFSHLAPQDIESVTVLKDGAAAIYGARAANGVILITTKRGKFGTPNISFNSAYSVSRFSAFPTLMNSEQYAIHTNETAERNGTPLQFTQEDIEKFAAGNDPINYPNTDWADLTFADYSPEWRNSISISGGTEKVNYFVSGDYIDQVGIFESGDLNFKQYQLRSNIDVQIHERVKLGVDVAGRFGDRNEPGVDAGFIYKHIYTNEPTEVGIYPNGLYAWGGENGANPAIMSSSESGFVNRIDNNFRTKLTLDLDLGWLTKGLSAQAYTGIRRWTTDTKDWYTPWEIYTFQQGTEEYIPSPGFSQNGDQRILRERFWQFNELMLNATLRYDRTFGEHTVRGLAGYERFTSNEREFWAERRGFPSDDRPDLFAGSDEGQISNGSSTEWARLNYFGMVSYDFKKKYFVDFTLRHDGSSNFGPGNRFGTFPGVAVAWSIADEEFMNFTNSWLDALKVRSSYAIMGNDRIPSFQFLTRYSYGGDVDVAFPNFYYFGTPGTRYNGYTSTSVPNPDITWETAEMRNVGLNFTMFNFRLTGDVNYFYQKREDILITRNASIPDFAGVTLPQENLGKVDNFGWEFQLGWNDKVGELTYNIGANVTQAKNRIVYLDEAVDVPDQLKREGFPMDSYIVYPTNGIFRDQEQVEAAPAKLGGTVEGEPFYVDTNEDGVIDAADRIRVYSSNVPEIQYGITGGLNYKGFDFSFLLQGQAKAQMLVFFDQAGSKPEHVFTERWTPENRDARYPRAFAQGDPYSGNLNAADNFQGADLWLHDASFLRLKELEFGYSIKKDRLKFGNVRVFARGLNLLTMFSEVAKLGLDPEAAGYNNFRGSTYPSLTSYSIGATLNFN